MSTLGSEDVLVVMGNGGVGRGETAAGGRALAPVVLSLLGVTTMVTSCDMPSSAGRHVDRDVNFLPWSLWFQRVIDNRVMIYK
jgi:hypothetical protein